MQVLFTGAFAGGAGAFAMTVVLRHVFPRVLPAGMQRGFLPMAVVKGIERKAVGHGVLTDEQRMDVTMPAHYGYGMAAGSVYGLIRERLAAPRAPALGALYGLAVWAVSYEGWLPAAGILPATTDRPPRQWVVPLLAHAVFGTATALAYETLADPSKSTARSYSRLPPGDERGIGQ